MRERPSGSPSLDRRTRSARSVPPVFCADSADDSVQTRLPSMADHKEISRAGRAPRRLWAAQRKPFDWSNQTQGTICGVIIGCVVVFSIAFQNFASKFLFATVKLSSV